MNYIDPFLESTPFLSQAKNCSPSVIPSFKSLLLKFGRLAIKSNNEKDPFFMEIKSCQGIGSKAALHVRGWTCRESVIEPSGKVLC